MIQAIEAWAAKRRVKTPHHNESAGVIERFNQSLEGKLRHFTSKGRTWLAAYTDALDAYNGSVEQALSDGPTAAVSPAEVWLARRLRFPSDTNARMGTWSKKPSQYAKEVSAQMEKMKSWIRQARDSYHKEMEEKHPRANRKIRKFDIGDEVTLFRPTSEKREDKISALQDGTFEIVETSDSGVDYKIQRWGSIRAPHWVHVNEIKKLKRWRCEADSDYESEGEHEVKDLESSCKSKREMELQQHQQTRGRRGRLRQLSAKEERHEQRWS